MPEMSDASIIFEFCKIAIPTTLQCLFMFLVPMINLYFIGFLENTLMTAGVGLAMTFVNILGLSVMVGINCA